MLSQKTRRLLLAVLCLSLAAAVLCGCRGASLPLEHLCATLPGDETVYGLDQGEDSFRFFQTDESGVLKAQFQQKMHIGDTYLTFGPLVRDGDAVYVLRRQASIVSDLILSETVYLCDFEHERLEPAWELPVNDPAQDTNLAVQVRNGVLTCFQTDYSGKVATARLMQAVPGGVLAEVTSFSFDIGVGFTDFYNSASGAVAFTTPRGEIYVVRPGKEPVRCFPSGEESKPLLVFTNDGENQLFVAGEDGVLYAIDVSKSGLAHLASTDETELELAGLSALRFARDGNYTAADDEGTTLLIFQSGTQTTLHTLRDLPGQIVLRSTLGLIAVWAAAMLCYLLRRAFLFLTRGTVPIVTKLLAAFLPILILSLLAMNAVVTGIFAKQMVDKQYERLYLLTAQQTATLNASYVEDCDPAAAFDSVYFFELRAALNVLPGQGKIREESGETQEVYNSNYFWLYKLQNGKLLSLICEQDYVGVPVESRYSSAVANQFYETVKSAQVCRTAFRDELGDWTILLTPVTNESGEVVGVIETGDTRQSLDYAVERGAEKLTVLNLGVLLLLAVLLSGVIAYSLYPLGILQRRVQEISDGKLGVQAPEKSRDEVGQITRTFNAMSRNVEFRDKEIRLTSDGYSRFVPARVFGLLEKSSVVDVQLEDQTSVEATVLNCTVGAFDSIARSLRSKEMFRLINQVLAKLVPVIDRTGGLVDRFDRAGLLAIYTDRPEKALDAAVRLCQRLREAELAETKGAPLDFHVTLSAGPAMIGIVGADQRLEAMTISEHTSFTGFLRPLAASYGAAVLMTGSAAALIPDFAARYHARTVGFVQMRTLNRLERLFDVYDGDGETVRRLKDETKKTFEKGVALFCSHEYYDARLAFIEVLKRNREDKAAKNYLYLCDTYYRQNSGTEQNVWIESY